MALKQDAAGGRHAKPVKVPGASLGDLFRNGVCLTLELEAAGLFRNAPKQPFLTPLDQRAILRGRTRNSLLEEVLLNSVLRELRECTESTYERWGLRFSRHRNVWVQDTVNVLGDVVADAGMVIMGKLVLDNVTFPEGMKTFGNPYDGLHNVPYIKLKGPVYL